MSLRIPGDNPGPVSGASGEARRWARLVALGALLWFGGAALHGQQPAEEALWNELGVGGHVVLLRHAIAPGGGDPPGFRLDDCTTQRNLSEEGRQQARAIGRAFRDRGIPVERVLTSQWCRCRETAELLALAPVEEYPVLNSFFSDRSTAEAQTRALTDYVGALEPDGNVMLVTHQVNITGLTGVYPRSGELVVLRPDGRGGFTLAGRMTPGG